MSSISEIEAELFGKQYPKDYLIDKLRKYLKDLEGILRGHIIFYWADINPLGGSLSNNLIVNDDLEIFRDMMFKRVYKDDLYLIITSPGGRIEAAESIMRYLDAKVKNLYAIIPYMAKSAATLICLMANKIYMGYYSALGSISPLVGEKHQDAIQVIEEFNNMMNIFSQPINTNEIIKNTLNKKGDAEKVENSKDSVLYNIDNNRSLESQQNQDLISQSLASIINPLIKMGYPLYEAKKAIEWVVEIANWALNRSKARNNSNQTVEINNLLEHLLIKKELKFHHRNISYNYAKEMGLPVELLEADHNKKMESLVLGAQNIMRILSDRFLVCKLLMASNGQVWYKEYRAKDSLKIKPDAQQDNSTAENESPRAACIPRDIQNSQTYHSDIGFIKEQEEKQRIEYEKIKEESKKTGKYSKWIDFVVQNVEHYSWEKRDEERR